MISKHRPIKVTLKDGRTILARVTKQDGDKINWISKDNTWKGKCLFSSVVQATPEEVLAFVNAQKAKLAPIHPLMANWTLGTTKRGPKMMEGYYYEVPIFYKNRCVGSLVDEGNGGCVDVRINDRACANQLSEDSKNWVEACGAKDSRESESSFWTWWEEARPHGKDSVTFFKESEAEIAQWLKDVKPVTNSRWFADEVNKG